MKTIGLGLWLCIIAVGTIKNAQKAISTHASFEFGPWREGTSPEVIGRRVSANFIPRPHMIQREDTVIHYAEACTW